MWVAMNDSFVSIVEDKDDVDVVVVRARVREDLEAFFDAAPISPSIIEATDSDYRFRVFASKNDVAMTLFYRIKDIDYTNFKNSVDQSWRHRAYTKIWSIMYEVQVFLYGDEEEPWWISYKNYPR